MRTTTIGRTLPVRCFGVLAMCVLSFACGSSEDTLTQALEAHADGQLERAAELYRDVLDEDPSNKYAHYNLGLIDQTAGRTDSAAGAYRRALEADPRFLPALFNLAVLLTKRDANEAITLYRRIIEIEPDRAAAHLNLGFLLKDTGKPVEGDAELRKAVQLDPALEERVTPRATVGPETPPP